MNYIIENNMDFIANYKKNYPKILIKKFMMIKLFDNLDNICLLSNSVLEKIMLRRIGHDLIVFHYIMRFVIKKRKSFRNNTSFNKSVKYPYYRSITNKLLPYIDDKDVKKRY